MKKWIKQRAFLMALLLGNMMFAQEKDISGVVTDTDGIPIIGANVIEKGTTNGVATDFDGKYSIVAASNAVLIFSYVGYKTQEISITSISSLNVRLMEDASQLDEVVIVGYGTQAKRDITGSIATINSDEIVERKTTNVSNALQGSVAGLVVTKSSGEPGSGYAIRIRGNTTLQGTNDPLVLIDDVPGGLNDVTPDQIESISVLKDGAAAAIYGSRAAAGVIIITTKRAKSGLFNVSYSTDYFINTPTKKREYVRALEYMQMDNEKSWNDNGNGDDLFPTWSEERINKYISGEAASNRNEYPDTDWAALIIKKQSTGQRHNINISGGSEKLRNNLFLGYEHQDALYDYRDWKRLTARLNNDIKISDKFGVIADINFKLIDNNNPIVNPISKALQAGPVYPAIWEDGRYAEGKSGDNIYLRLQEGGFSEREEYLFTGKLGAYFKPIEDLKISVNITPTITFIDTKTFSKEARYWDVDDSGQILDGNTETYQSSTSLFESRYQFKALTTQALVNYDKNFHNHKLNMLAGFEERSSTTKNLSVKGANYLSSDFPYLNQAPTAEVYDNGSSISEVAYSSFFGRLNYNYNDKYNFSAAIRRDGSSRFGSDYRWGTFPSISAAWIISNEEFLKNVINIPFLKFKGSYGSLGNDRLGNYLYITLLQIQNVLIANGSDVEEVRALSQLFLTTPNIKWEKTVSKNLGLEIGLFDSKLSIEAEYFLKETKDMLLNLSVPDLVGFEDPIVNVGGMTTKGWETSATWNDYINDEIRYSVSFNVSDAESIIGNINGKRLFDGVTLSEEGHEFRELFGLQSEGLFQTQEDVDNSPVTSASVKPGDVKYKDLSGPDGTPDGVINDFDRTFLGSSLPRYTFGGRVSIDYKGFNLGLVFQGVGKQNFYLSQSYIRPFLESGWLAPNKEYTSSYWSVNNTSEANQNVKYPRLSEASASNNYRFSDFWLKDGSYLRIKSLSLGYSLPSSLMEKTPFTNLSFSLTGNDLFTWDNLPESVDPEQTSGTGYFLTKSVVFGVKVNF